jgi:hypothetical protein
VKVKIALRQSGFDLRLIEWAAEAVSAPGPPPAVSQNYWRPFRYAVKYVLQTVIKRNDSGALSPALSGLNFDVLGDAVNVCPTKPQEVAQAKTWVSGQVGGVCDLGGATGFKLRNISIRPNDFRSISSVSPSNAFTGVRRDFA